MFQSKTLFVVGAGASKEVGLPIGSELKALISNVLNIRFEHGVRQVSGDEIIVEALRARVNDSETGRRGDINPFLQAAWSVRDAMPQAISIDNFIDAHRDNARIELVGKLAISRTILQAEKQSQLFFDRNKLEKMGFPKIAGTWYSAFFQLMTENVSRSQVSAALRNIGFVIFNYDRCVEWFLVQALSNYYGISEQEAAEIVFEYVMFFHPYGRVGVLAVSSHGSEHVSFGGVPQRGSPLLAISNQIKTFTEQIDEDDYLQSIRNSVEDAETIVFLGFGFHQQNLSLIAPKQPTAVRRIFGTAFGMSASDAATVSSDLVTWAAKPSDEVDIKISTKLTCADLFREHWRGLPRPA